MEGKMKHTKDEFNLKGFGIALFLGATIGCLLSWGGKCGTVLGAGFFGAIYIDSFLS